MSGLTTICQGLPLYPGSPTDWSNLYTSLKLVQGINVSVTDHAKTIVTFDLKLYAKWMQLRERSDIAENFIFRLGELHIVFVMLKVMGKYITCSGIDCLFIETGIYGPTTLGQIIDGKHMKRGLEAHMTMYLALYSVYLKEALKCADIDWIDIQNQLQAALTQFLDVSLDDTTNHLVQHNKLLDIIHGSSLPCKLHEFNNSLQNQALFLYNYMSMFESLLLFIRASRQSLWKLHLESLNNFTKYFFAHDQLNYARLTLQGLGLF